MTYTLYQYLAGLNKWNPNLSEEIVLGVRQDVLRAAPWCRRQSTLAWTKSIRLLEDPCKGGDELAFLMKKHQ